MDDQFIKTPLQIAREAVQLWVQGAVTGGAKTSELERFIAGAVLHEREQCAKVADYNNAENIAQQIRHRPGGVGNLSRLILPGGKA